MATIWKEIDINADVGTLWAMLRDVGAANKAFVQVLTGCTIDDDLRTVTFANGMIVRERIVAVDEAHRRVAYTTLGESFDHHHASMQALDLGNGRSRFLWVSDVLPAEAAQNIQPLVDQGAIAIRAAAEARQL